MIPEFEEIDEAVSPPVRCRIVPPYTEHPPCGMPGCGRSETGKWASPVWEFEVRPISRTWGGLETAAYPFLICGRCFSTLDCLYSESLRAEEEKHNE